MGFNHIGDLKLEGHQSVTLPFKFGNYDDVGAQYFAANPIGVFLSNGIGGNVGWVTTVNQQKAKLWGEGDRVQTWYFVTVANRMPGGVECDFDGGGF